MNNKKKILFILNPRAGHGLNKRIFDIADDLLDQSKFELHFATTEYRGHARVLAKKAVEEQFQYVVSVGGDGTVNEVAASLINSNVALAIVPTGSGNGLARHLNIPMQLSKAIELLNNEHAIWIDTFEVNQLFAINIAGVGFDGLIAHRFAQQSKRGFFTYIKIVIEEVLRFKNFEVTDAYGEQKQVWMVSIANSGQFGNNAWIAPNASCNDGLINVIYCSRMNLMQMIPFALKMFLKKLTPTDYYYEHKGAAMTIRFSTEQPLHIDGEAAQFCSKVDILCHPQSLKIIVPQHVK